MTYESAMEAIRSLKEKFKESQLFGVEKDKSFHSSIGQIYQTWDGTLVALTLMIAGNRMDEMDIHVKLFT